MSKIGSLPPESIVFTYGLHLESALLALAFLLIFHKNKLKIDHLSSSSTTNGLGTATNASHRSCLLESFKDPSNLNHCPLLFLGLAGCLCMSIVGSVSLGVDYTAHTTFASIMFVCFVLHMLLSSMTVDAHVGLSIRQIRLHRLCLFICIPLNIVFAVAAQITFKSCGSFSCLYFYVNISPILEYLTVISLLVYMVRFKDDLSSMSVATIFIDAIESGELASAIYARDLEDPTVDP